MGFMNYQALSTKTEPRFCSNCRTHFEYKQDDTRFIVKCPKCGQELLTEEQLVEAAVMLKTAYRRIRGAMGMWFSGEESDSFYCGDIEFREDWANLQYDIGQLRMMQEVLDPMSKKCGAIAGNFESDVVDRNKMIPALEEQEVCIRKVRAKRREELRKQQGNLKRTRNV